MGRGHPDRLVCRMQTPPRAKLIIDASSLKTQQTTNPLFIAF